MARVGDVLHVIYFVVFCGVLISPCRSVCIQETTPQPPPLNWVSLGHAHAHHSRDVSHEGKYLFSIPRSGGWWGYISGRFWDTPPREPPPGEKLSMMNDGPFCILIQGGLLMDRCHPVTRQMVKIRRLGVELPMVTAIRMSGYTHV